MFKPPPFSILPLSDTVVFARLLLIVRGPGQVSSWESSPQGCHLRAAFSRGGPLLPSPGQLVTALEDEDACCRPEWSRSRTCSQRRRFWDWLLSSEVTEPRA